MKVKKDRDECVFEFWDSFVRALNRAGGISDLSVWKDKSLYHLAMVLAQNGIRFHYDKDGTLK